VFFHSDRKDVTDQIYALAGEQKKNLSVFLADSSGQQYEVLPIVGDSRNRVRVNPEDAVLMFHALSGSMGKGSPGLSTISKTL
jgi:hypothetical protein